MQTRDKSINQAPNKDYVPGTGECDSVGSSNEVITKNLKGQAKTESVATNSTSGRSNIEIGGRVGPDPTRYGDWEKNGRCIDF